MKPEDFRRYAHQVVDWMADYLEEVENLPVRSQVEPGAIAAQIRPHAPEDGEEFATILADFKRIVMPGMTHWQHPNFFAYFPANNSPPSILAEMLIATLGAQCMLWQTSPAATELETRMMEWLGQLLALPGEWDGVIQDSASSATLCAALCARERSIAWQGNAHGLGGRPAFRAYATEEVHSSIPKALRIAGYGDSNLVRVATDNSRAMDPDALQQAIAKDRAQGHNPTLVVACIGSTGVGASDHIEPLGKICQAEGLYLHVDAAWAGSALISPRYRSLAKGIEYADSFVFNPHKWLLTNFDCSAHFVRDRQTLLRTLAILPAYLNSDETGAVIDYRDWSVPLGRRFRALKLWFVLRSYGAKHLRAMVENHVTWTHELAEEIQAHPHFELVDGPRLALLNFRFAPAGTAAADLDTLNARLRERINAKGVTYVTGNVVDGKTTIRFSVGQANTQRGHVFAAWQHICELASSLGTAKGRPTVSA